MFSSVITPSHLAITFDSRCSESAVGSMVKDCVVKLGSPWFVWSEDV